jgi:hypothetical protein
VLVGSTDKPGKLPKQGLLYGRSASHKKRKRTSLS